MTHAPFSLKDMLITYGGDGRACRVESPLSELICANIDFVIGVSDFSDDDSVHAGYWEYHPTGDEILCVLAGRLLAVVDDDGAAKEVVIEEGQAFIVPRANWHRLRVLEPGRLLFLTPTAGLQLRPHATDIDNHRHQITEGRFA